MIRPRGTDVALLLLAAACLLFGGGLGCEEDADGVSFRAAQIEGERYFGITGKKEPGEGSLRFPYPLDPPFYGKVNIGVFNPRVLEQTVGSVGYGQLERVDLGERYRMEVRYEITPAIGLRFTSNLDANDAFCPDVTRAFMRIDDNATTAQLRYKCDEADPWSTLTTAGSLYTGGELWYWRVGAFGLGKKDQIGFNHYRVESAPPTAPSPERAAGFATFDFFRYGLRAFRHIEDGETLDAQADANTALGALIAAKSLIQSGTADFSGTSVERNLIKADKTFFKSYTSLQDGRTEPYLKSFQKGVWPTTWSLAEMWSVY
jgi:hypothetical protein